MKLPKFDKTFVKDTLINATAAGLLASGAAVAAPLIGLSGVAGAVFVGTLALTSGSVVSICKNIFKINAITFQNQPYKKIACVCAVSVLSIGSGILAGVGVSALLGVPVAVGAGLKMIVLSSTVLTVTAIAGTTLALAAISTVITALSTLVIVGAVAIGGGIIYAVTKKRVGTT